MSRKFKLITALLAMIMCFSVFSLTAFAVGEEESGGDISTVEPDTPVEPENPGSEPEPDVSDVPSQPDYSDPVYTDPIYTTPSYDPGYDEPDEPSYEYNSSSQIYYETDNGGESSEFYVGGGQSYVPPASTAPSAPLYQSNHKIDDSVLSNSDWKDISASLKNAGNSGDNDSDDFGFIKNNDSLNDNGEWMLYSGIACLALSAAGIVYVIVSVVNKRKKLGGGLNTKQYAYAGADNGRYRSSDDYDDGYKSQKSNSKRVGRSRKFDTADVKIPKSSNGKRYKNSGKRYK